MHPLTSSSEAEGSSTSTTSSTHHFQHFYHPSSRSQKRLGGTEGKGAWQCPLTFVLEEAVDALSSIHSRHLACANTTSNTSNTSSIDAKCVTTSARQMPVHSNTALCMAGLQCTHARTPPLPSFPQTRWCASSPCEACIVSMVRSVSVRSVRRTTAGAVFRTSHVL